jgi:peptidoglycan/xylan/chitin deacetylase (PgdA/CDA1 family)
VNKSVIRILISALLFFTFAAPSYSKGVYILCYHAFLEKKDPYSFSTDQFREQLNKLKSSGFTFVTFEDVVNDRLTGNKNILISIDDGNKSVYQAYFSIMKPMGIKPLLGIYPAIIGRVEYAMNWEQVKKLSDDGCYIASHGYHHMFLSTKYYGEDKASFLKEIYLSKKILEEKLNRKIEAMVYPFGVNSEIAISELQKAGYKYGMTIEPKMASFPFKDSFQINRYLMTKPGQKGVIAYITKNAGTAQSEVVQASANTAQNTGQKNEKTGNMLSIISYPERIKKIMADDLIIPVKVETDKPKKVKFKPFVHSSKTPASSKNKNKKITAKNEKKNQRKKKAA